MNWFAIPHYRYEATWVATLDCGHSGVVAIQLESLPRDVPYGCFRCEGHRKLVHGARLPPTRETA